jgi:hypothetical protein
LIAVLRSVAAVDVSWSAVVKAFSSTADLLIADWLAPNCESVIPGRCQRVRPIGRPDDGLRTERGISRFPDVQLHI